MPTARSFIAAVHIPDVGVLVLGGMNQWFGDKLSTAEMLVGGEGCIVREECKWSAISAMLRPRMMPLAVFHNNRVLVTELTSALPTFEMLALSNGQPSQWTSLYFQNQFIDNFSPWCLVNCQGRLLLSGIC